MQEVLEPPQPLEPALEQGLDWAQGPGMDRALELDRALGLDLAVKLEEELELPGGLYVHGDHAFA